jgi:hypothetical protein
VRPNFFASGRIFWKILPKSFAKSWQHWGGGVTIVSVHSPNDQYLNNHSPNDQSSENLKCNQSPNATISQMTILRTTNLLMQPILASFSSGIDHGHYISDRDPDRQGFEALAGSNPDQEQKSD